MKTCPICQAVCFDDMDVCFGCLHSFANDVSGREGGFLHEGGSGTVIMDAREKQRSADGTGREGDADGADALGAAGNASSANGSRGAGVPPSLEESCGVVEATGDAMILRIEIPASVVLAAQANVRSR